ncbi:MAG: hypothetical protein JWN91_2415 [Nocardioides sp.]|nr:hypothetical protein [Nocardioides sp.]
MATLWTLGCDAHVVREEHYGDDFGHIVMSDPEGNELCVG